MSMTSECPRCSRSELVRVEATVKAEVTERKFDCGHCGYVWFDTEVTDRRVKSVLRRHNSRTDRRKAVAALKPASPVTGLRCPACEQPVGIIEHVVAGRVLVIRCPNCSNQWSADSPNRTN